MLDLLATFSLHCSMQPLALDLCTSSTAFFLVQIVINNNLNLKLEIYFSHIDFVSWHRSCVSQPIVERPWAFPQLADAAELPSFAEREVHKVGGQVIGNHP